MKKQLVLTSAPIPIANIQLGSLIPDYLHPTIDAIALIKPSITDLQISPQISYKGLLKTYRKTTLSPHLAIFGYDISHDKDVDVVIKATRGMLYELKAPTTWFRRLCQETEAREWIQERARVRRSMYLVTGYRTFDDAQVTHDEKDGREVGTRINTPASPITSAIRSGLSASFGVDTGLDTKIERSSKTNEAYTAPGEQIYAIQYRRVNVGWFRSRSVTQTTLNDKIYWEDVFIHRGEENEEDMVEAELATTLRLGRSTERISDEGCDDEYLIVLGGE